MLFIYTKCSTLMGYYILKIHLSELTYRVPLNDSQNNLFDLFQPNKLHPSCLPNNNNRSMILFYARIGVFFLFTFKCLRYSTNHRSNIL